MNRYLVAAIVLFRTAIAVGQTTALSLVDSHKLFFSEPARHVPTEKMPDGPLLGNGDIGVVVAGNPDSLCFYIGKNDLWGVQTAAPMPAGKIRLAAPALSGASYKAEVDMRRAFWQGTFKKDSNMLSVRAWVDANGQHIFIEVKNEAAGPIQLSFSADPCIAGFAASLLGADGTVITLAPHARAVYGAALFTGTDPLKRARSEVNSLTIGAVDRLFAAHQAWWERFWEKSFIEIPDKVIEQHWYSTQYIMGSCSRGGKIAPGLWGNWVTTDHPAWHGDYHLNYNFQAPYYSVFSSNHADISMPYFDAVGQMVPFGQRLAAEHGWKGVFLPVSMGPWGTSPEGPDSHWGQRSNAIFAALPFIWYYQYTQDKEWLRKTGYPYLRQVEQFWTDYLVLENGRYMDYHDAIHEGSGGAGRSGTSADVNPLLTLGLLKTFYKSMLAMSADLGVDAALRPKWKDIAERLSAFPTQVRGGDTVFRYTETGTAWWDDNTLGIQHIFPAGAIGLGSGPELLKVSRNTIDAMNRWVDGNGSSSWYTACARIGYAPEKILSELRAMYDRHSMPNGLLYFGGGGIENVSPSLAINEMLLQSYEGVVRFFPCWPRQLDARFGSLRAVGAFLVSAGLKGGVVRDVSVFSEKGKPLTVENPWGNGKVQVYRNGKKAEAVEGARFRLATSPKETIRFEFLNTGAND